MKDSHVMYLCTPHDRKANQKPMSCGMVDHSEYHRARSITMWQRTWPWAIGPQLVLIELVMNVN